MSLTVGLDHSAIDPYRLAAKASDTPLPGTFEALFNALDASARPLGGPARPWLLVIPLHDDAGAVAGGFWGCTLFQWLHIQMLFVPEPMRARGLGSALVAAAEIVARDRGCGAALVDTFSPQATSFYRKLGYSVFGALDDYPLGQRRLYFQKQFADTGEP